MRKCLFALVALFASSAMAQQNIDITAEQFKSGAADSQLSTLGRQAASSGKRLVVTAPQHWHAQIASSIRAGGDAEIVLKDGFYETLLVRVEDKAAAAAVVESKPELKPEPKPEPKPVAATPKPEPALADLPVPPPTQSVVEAPVPMPTPEPEPEPLVQAPVPAKQVVEEIPAARVVEEAPAPAPEPVAQAPAPAEQAVAEAPVAAAAEEAPDAAVAATTGLVERKDPMMLVATEPGDVDPLRAMMEERYNRGRRIVERVEPSQLRRSDVIHTAKGTAVVVRLEGNQVIRMWLVGSINLKQTAIGHEGANKYRVLKANLQ